MPDDIPAHHRHSIRLPGFDYRHGRAYFVTMCAADRASVFGRVTNGRVELSQLGHIATACWLDLPHHHPWVCLDEFVVMPNHIHAIVWIDPPDGQRATQVSPLQAPRRPRGPAASSLGAVIGAYKAAVSREINRLRLWAGGHLWQRNYYEHIIRDDDALLAIREYITMNPARWEQDRENPEGTGRDDHEAFVRSIRVRRREEGDTGVAPTGNRRTA